METFIDNKKRWLSPESMENEVWIRMEEHPFYFISNYGRVKSDDRKVNYSCHGETNAYRLIKGKIMKLSPIVYLMVGLKDSAKEKQRPYPVHRLVAKSFLPNPENKPFVNHKDGNKFNNYIHIREDGSVDFEKSNLEWCTSRENIDHAVANNLVAYGNRSSKSKLTEYQVVEIKSLLAKGYTCKDIAKKYNVHISTISLINKGKNWRRVPNVKEEKEFCLWNHLLQKSLDGTILYEYDSVNEAHKITGFSITQIRRCCAGERESFQGYKWEFIKLRGSAIL